MLAIQHKQLIDLVRPELKKRGFFKNLFNMFFIGGIQRDPGSLCFHADGIMIDNAFVDAIINICPVGWDKIHEIIGDLELYGDLELRHLY